MPKDGITRINVVVHGNPGGELYDDKNNKIKVEDIAKKLNELIKDNNNVMVNLITCSGGKGTHAYSQNDANSAGAELQRQLSDLAGRSIPVRARRNIMVVTSEGNKSVYDMNVSHKVASQEMSEYEKAPAHLKESKYPKIVSKHPGSKSEYNINAQGEQVKSDVYYTGLKDKVINFLEQLKEQQRNNEGMKSEIDRWLTACKDKNIEDTFEFIKSEYKNPASFLNTTKDNANTSLFHIMMPKLIEIQLILNSKHTEKESQVVAKQTNGRWDLQAAYIADKTPNQLYVPFANMRELVQINNDRMIKKILEQRPDMMQTFADYELAIKYSTDRNKLFMTFVEHGDKNALLQEWLQKPDLLTHHQGNYLLNSFKTDELSMLIQKDNSLLPEILNQCDSQQYTDILRSLKASGMKYDLKSVSNLFQQFNHHDFELKQALKEGLLPLHFKGDKVSITNLDGFDPNNKSHCLAVLSNYHNERNADAREHLSFRAKLQSGRDKTKKLEATEVLMKAFVESIKNPNKGKITVKLGDKLTQQDFDKVVSNGRLKNIYKSIESNQKLEFEGGKKPQTTVRMR